MDYVEIAAQFRRLALEAGAKIMEVYGTDDFGVKAKDDESPVTVADEAADALISAGLRA
ncbi:MAG: 3'(2'),5'-bisphosphate nucleotidase CysQ, partial [Pseudomonadota bacterium]